MTSNLKYGLIFILVLLASCGGCRKQTLPSLQETYQKNDKRPFGGYVAFREFSDFVEEKEEAGSLVLTKPLSNEWQVWDQENDGEVLVYVVAQNLILSGYEINEMLSFADRGNQLFLAADYFDPQLLKRLHTIVERDAEIQTESSGKMDIQALPIPPQKTVAHGSTGYYFFPFLNYFKFEDRTGKALGYNSLGQPNFIVLQYGKGKIYLHAAPRAFGNYFLLTGQNDSYFDFVLSSLPQNLSLYVWDEFYKMPPQRREQQAESNPSFSTMRVINQYPSLQWAFWLTVAGILLFVIFQTKRRQSAIAVRAPKSNATIAFTETIGRLYLHHKDNRNIADKQITYFNEWIRNQYFITFANEESFVQALAGKSGIAESKVQDLFRLIRSVQTKTTVTDQELLLLDEKITYFIKNRK